MKNEIKDNIGDKGIEPIRFDDLAHEMNEWNEPIILIALKVVHDWWIND